MSEILMPSLGAEMDEGTLIEWYVKPGDHIEYGEVIALLDTEKAEIEMESFDSGTIDCLLIGPGETVSVGDPVATLLDSDAKANAARPPVPAVDSPSRDAMTRPTQTHREAFAEPPATKGLGPGVPTIPPSGSEPARIKATPLARRLANERGIDLSTLSGSGPHGALIEADIPTFSKKQANPSASASRAARRREIIAAAMTRSKREIPHYYLSHRIEIDNAIDWLATQNQDRAASNRLVLSALLIKAVALAAKKFPEFNGHWLEDGFHPNPAVHIGMVVSLRSGGLVVPTFHDAAERPIAELMADLRDVVGRVRAGRLRSSELGDSTLTITSLGNDGAEAIFGVIYPPQVAIVGFGGIHSAVRAEGKLHGVQSVIRATLAADHRASDGQQGSRFLQSIANNLRDPEQL